jgi:hypothetical protein
VAAFPRAVRVPAHRRHHRRRILQVEPGRAGPGDLNAVLVEFRPVFGADIHEAGKRDQREFELVLVLHLRRHGLDHAVDGILERGQLAARHRARCVEHQRDFTGFLIEKSLSVDNLFVFLLIMSRFAVPKQFQQKVLMVGIILALVMLLISGAFVSSALFPATLLWLPGALIGNLIGTAIGRRLPHALFRTFTLGVVVIAGILTIVTS